MLSSLMHSIFKGRVEAAFLLKAITEKHKVKCSSAFLVFLINHIDVRPVLLFNEINTVVLFTH